MIRPSDPWAEAQNELAASRLRMMRGDFVARRMEVTCPVCGQPCSKIGREAILLIELEDGWKCYRPGRTFWQHEDRTCITDQDRSRPREGDVVA